MYLFQLVKLAVWLQQCQHLHSTMYLFQHITATEQWQRLAYLHSTMYLFQRSRTQGSEEKIQQFTFHYVSISTVAQQRAGKPWFIIYIPLCIYFNSNCNRMFIIEFQFTFHYVSISTDDVVIDFSVLKNLHSTMYLFQLYALTINVRSVCLIYIPLCIYFNGK